MRTLLTLVLAAGTAAAADKPATPAVEVRVKSVNDLLDPFEYLGGVVGQEEQAKQGVALIRAFAGKKGLEGVDIKRPAGLYASLTPAMIDSPVVLLVPVADEEAFLNLLKNRLNLDPKKGDDGVYAMDVPNVPPKVYFKFHKGYACGTLHNKAALDDAALLDPKEFFAAADAAAVSVALNLDRVPDEVKKMALGQFELKLKDVLKQNEGKPPAEKALAEVGSETVFRAVRSAAEDGKALTVRLLVEPEGDDLTVDVSLTVKDDSYLKKTFASAAKRQSATKSAAAGTHPVASVMLNATLPDWLKTMVDKAVDVAITDAIDKAGDRGAAQKVLDSLVPTLKSGDLDLAASLTGTAKAHRLTAAVKIKEGGGVEKVVKEFAGFIPADQATLTTDVAKSGSANIHQLVVPQPPVTELFGTDKFWLGLADELLVVTAEPDGDAAKKAATAAPAAGDIFRAEVSVARVAPLAEKRLSADEVKGVITEVFGSKPVDGKDTMTLTVAGGDKLSVRLAVKGRAVKLLAIVDQKSKSKN